MPLASLIIISLVFMCPCVFRSPYCRYTPIDVFALLLSRATRRQRSQLLSRLFCNYVIVFLLETFFISTYTEKSASKSRNYFFATVLCIPWYTSVQFARSKLEWPMVATLDTRYFTRFVRYPSQQTTYFTLTLSNCNFP